MFIPLGVSIHVLLKKIKIWLEIPPRVYTFLKPKNSEFWNLPDLKIIDLWFNIQNTVILS